MQIKDVMTKNVQVIAPDASIVEAARMMKEQDTGFLPVCDGNKILGSVTDRDIVIRAIAQGLNAENTPVRSAMSAGISWCFDSDDVTEAAEKMKDGKIRRLVVVDQSKKLVGVISLGDLATDVGDRSIKAETLTEISKPGHNPDMA
ncbi:MAG: CBS domain-containing protein [Myxococcaceae bacterium]